MDLMAVVFDQILHWDYNVTYLGPSLWNEVSIIYLQCHLIDAHGTCLSY